MDPRVCARPGCGNPLLPGRELEGVCSYACRGQMKVEAIQGQTGLSGSKNIKQNKALQSLKRRSVGVPTFAKINSCTYRMDSPKNNGAGWLMEVAPQGAQGSDGLHEWAIGQVSRCRSRRQSGQPLQCFATVERSSLAIG